MASLTLHSDVQRGPVNGSRVWLGLAAFLALCLGAGWIGSLVTMPEIDGWYQSLVKPSWQPPRWLFGPVWTTLYILMGVAAWLVWRRRGFSGAGAALTLFGVQLLLNIAWSYIFFGAHELLLASVEIVILWIAILATILAFRRHSGAAALLMLPYILWVSFASALTFTIWQLNS